MSDKNDLSNKRPRVHVLKESVARKIAAGEVIDRPQAVLRELLDNSLDAGAKAIEVHIEAGGLENIIVKDNGWGMTEEDLSLCHLPHTTSKIENEDDLETLTSLGFRGEALASIAACSLLTITTRCDSGPALQVRIVQGKPEALKKTAGTQGTIIQVQNLFYELPARKRFLKSPGAESALCRRVLEEKALAFPQVSFRYWVEDQLKFDLPGQNLEQRLASLWGSPWNETDQISFAETAGEGFTWKVWVLMPPQHRADRKGIHVWANQRPIQEFAFLQAVSYAFEGYLPGGAFPYAAVFLQVDPSLADFNIHPAKREARFRQPEILHKALLSTVRQALDKAKIRSALFQKALENQVQNESQNDFTFAENRQSTNPGNLYSRAPEVIRGRGGFASVYTWDPDQKKTLSENQVQDKTYPFRYLGQVLGVFLIAELQDQLYLVDQHAAHERLLFDQIRAKATKEAQPLLFPRAFRAVEETERILLSSLKDFQALGFDIISLGSGKFELLKIPASVADKENQIIEFLCSLKHLPEDLENQLYATIACRSALMDGDPVAPDQAQELIAKALLLDNARCPHGRPVWTILTRQELFTRVGRLV